jgi:ribosomal protein S18 acetylase RimI-like enzyme
VVELRRLTSGDWQLWRDVRLQALEDAPEAFSSLLSDWQGDGDVEVRWRKRLDDVPFNVVAFVAGRLVGQVSGTAVDGRRSVELMSLWVAPGARGVGVATGLIEAVAEWARSAGAECVSLAVKRENSPAIALYERTGFTDRGANPEAADERLMTLCLTNTMTTMSE